MTVLLHPAPSDSVWDLVWQDKIPPESPDWYFPEVHRVDKHSVQLHLFHYRCEGFGFCPIERVQHPFYYVRHVKTWEELFSLSEAAEILGIPPGLIDKWQGIGKNWIRQVKDGTTKHTTYAHVAC
jgi:hypothetical protein